MVPGDFCICAPPDAEATLEKGKTVAKLSGLTPFDFLESVQQSHGRAINASLC
jgi:hypothetical protein